MGTIGNPFAFAGRIGRLPFILATLGLLAVQQIAHHILVGDYWFSLTAFANPWFANASKAWLPLFAERGSATGIIYGVPIAVIIASGWVLSALAFRRATAVGANPGLAALVLIPFVQLGAIAWLALKADIDPLEDSDAEPRRQRWRAALLGVLIGSAISVAMVVLFAFALGEYGAGLFVGVPVFIGFAAGYAANRDGDIGGKSTIKVAAAALGLGALALAGFALEGALCLVMALPITGIMAFIGALIGRAWVLRRGFRGTTLMSVSLMPLLLAGEAFSPPEAKFESVESIDVMASPQQVWDSVIHMGPISGRPAAPFGWGLAYPVRGTIRGSGVGAVREGVFSTGVAYERVTRWEPGRALDFIVLSDPPSLRELSPFTQVSAPHVSGYFKTRDARFAITPLGNGRTRLTLATTHELRIGPTPYWQPLAAWAVHANKRRVLAHFRNQAEDRTRTETR